MDGTEKNKYTILLHEGYPILIPKDKYTYYKNGILLDIISEEDFYSILISHPSCEHMILLGIELSFYITYNNSYLDDILSLLSPEELLTLKQGEIG